MKVLCINGDGWIREGRKWWGKKYIKETAGPSFGDVVTVTDGYWETGQYFYNLVEWPEEVDGGYEAACFIKCSEIDETEMIRETLITNP